jgi:hypothetical protein
VLFEVLLFQSSVLERLRRETVARTGERRGVYRVLMGKPEGKRQLGRPRRRWEDTIKMDLQEVGCGAWNGSSCLRLRISGGHFKCGNEPSGSIKCGEFLDQLRTG